ncbi:MAG: TonB-dependent receptor [Dysgonamonadaceae bacterium]|jgi:TonB-linked SusC/RagA family outer membrane protein|nr:TonB-dependent receptor [Dysgonamonadaceae bacterium]
MKKKLRIFSLLTVFCFACIYAIEGNADNLNLSKTQQNPVKITGKVVDAGTGEALIGVGVVEKGTGTGMATDVNGSFMLTVSNPEAILEVSYLGYAPVSYKLNGHKEVVILMQEDTQTLDEVVVVGYGTQKKVNLTGAVSAVKIGEQTASRSVSNVSSGLVGLLPGLTVMQSTGFAGFNGASLQIRGLGTINNANPLIVVDGMPDVDINRIDMNDIESVSVLKDAASSAVYGSRAANGVILITTKTGRGQEKAKVSYSGNYGISQPSNFYNYLADYSRAMQMQIRAAQAGNQNSNFRQSSVEQWLAMSLVDPVLFPNTNQYEEMFRTATMSSHNLSASGGNDRHNFYLSVGVMNEEGLQIHNEHDRYNMRFNLDYKIRDNFKVGIKTDGQWSVTNYPRSAGLENAGLMYAVSGVLNVHPETGEYGGAMAYGEETSAGNMVLEYEAYRSIRTQQGYNGALYGEWEVIKGLKATVSYGLNYLNRFDKSYQNITPQYNFQLGTVARTMPTDDQINNSNQQDYKTLLEGRLSYDKEIAGGHHLTALVAATEEYWNRRAFSAQRKERLHPTLTELDAASQSNMTNGGWSDAEGLRSFLGNLHYRLQEKYILDLSFRYDGSSKFVKGHQWGFFPSVGASWRISEETFFEPLKKVFSSAKIKASVGTLGNNSGPGRYEQKNTLATTNYILDGKIVKGFSASKMINPNLTWESTKVTNLGLDLGFLKNKLIAEFAVYERYTSDMIRSSTLSSVLTGYDAPRINIGDMRNRGVEVEINWSDKIGAVKYNVNLNASYNQNILKVWGDYLGKGWERIDMPYRFMYVLQAYPGLIQSWNDIYNAPYQKSTNLAPGDILYKDVTGDGKITDDDKVAFPNHYRQKPNGQYGVTLGLQYRGFDFQALVQGSYGRYDLWLDNYNNVNVPVSRYAFADFHWNDTWTLDNRGASMPRLVTGSGGNNRDESTFWAYNTAYARLKNLQIGYAVPKSLLKKISFDRVRIFCSAENLFTLSEWKGVDPEKIRDADAYPLIKTFSAGLNVEF